MKKHIGTWVIDCDKLSTQKAYENLDFKTVKCSCQSCLNYYKAVSAFPTVVYDFFNDLGIDINKPVEIYNLDYSNGVVSYGGFYYLVGEYLLGNDIKQSISDTSPSPSFYKLEQDYAIAFTRDLDILPDNFPENSVQLEISFSVPWVLKCPYQN